MRKTVSRISSVLLIASTLILAFNIQLVKTQESSDLPLTWVKYPNYLILPGETYADRYNGQVHPDVIYFDTPKDGYKFWMVYTPYPDNPQEQPYVVRSNNGIDWTDAGIVNPVVKTNTYPWNSDHQSDPDWCYIPEYGKFFLLWGVATGRTEGNIAFAYSTDAQHWSFDAFGSNEPILVQNAATPTVVYKNGTFQVWFTPVPIQVKYLEPLYYLTFQWDNNNNRVINQSSLQGPWYATSNETANFTGYNFFDIYGNPVDGNYSQGLSHPTVVCFGNDYYLFGSCLPVGATNNITLYNSKILHCWKGTPPFNFTDYGTLLSTSYSGWDDQLIYKSVLLHDCYGNLVTPDDQFWLYYSGYHNNVPHIGLAAARAPANVAVTGVQTCRNIISNTTSTLMNITVVNQGEFPEIFNTALYINSTSLGTQNVFLTRGMSTNVSFTLNLTNFNYGNYTMSAYAWPAAGEMDRTNSNMTSWIIVTIPGDVDGNFQVTLTDLVLLANAYSSHPSDQKWNPNADINGNGAVDLSDLVLMANHYGQHYP